MISRTPSARCAQALALLGLLPASCFAAADHFELTAPGFRNGNHPYTLYAGDCYAVTITANNPDGTVDAGFSGTVQVQQFAINDQNGSLINPLPGIAKANDLAQLGKSSVSISMTNGSFTFGAGGSLSTQLCFYFATRAPQDYKQTDSLGDVILYASSTVNNLGTLVAGKSNQNSYVVWHNTPQKITLLLPNQGLAPATVAGSTGTVQAQRLGVPFTATARIVDQFWNPIIKDSSTSDPIRFSASLPTALSFSPVAGDMANGILHSAVTVTTSGVCGSTVTVTATDLASHGPNFTQSDTKEVYISSCSGGGGGSGPPGQNPGFYQMSVPGLVTAGTPFSMDVIAKNVDIASLGALNYTGSLIPLTAVSVTQFELAGGNLGTPLFNFSIPSGFQGDFTHTLAAQTYNVAQILWVQLVGGSSPPELTGASVIAGPIQVLPGTPVKITAGAAPSKLGARSSSQIALSLVDAFNNGIAGKTLAVQMVQGSQGSLSAGGASGGFLQIQTDISGRAIVAFESGTVSENVILRVNAPSFPAIPSVDVSLLVTLLGDKTVAAYPSPVRITERPLTIEYLLDAESDVTLWVTDIFGQGVWRTTLPSGSPGGLKGFNKVLWDGKNGGGRVVAAGVYALHLEIRANGRTAKASTRFGVRK